MATVGRGGGAGRRHCPVSRLRTVSPRGRGFPQELPPAWRLGPGAAARSSGAGAPGPAAPPARPRPGSRHLAAPPRPAVRGRQKPVGTKQRWRPWRPGSARMSSSGAGPGRAPPPAWEPAPKKRSGEAGVPAGGAGDVGGQGDARPGVRASRPGRRCRGPTPSPQEPRGRRPGRTREGLGRGGAGAAAAVTRGAGLRPLPGSRAPPPPAPAPSPSGRRSRGRAGRPEPPARGAAPLPRHPRGGRRADCGSRAGRARARARERERPAPGT